MGHILIREIFSAQITKLISDTLLASKQVNSSPLYFILAMAARGMQLATMFFHTMIYFLDSHSEKKPVSDSLN